MPKIKERSLAHLQDHSKKADDMPFYLHINFFINKIQSLHIKHYVVPRNDDEGEK